MYIYTVQRRLCHLGHLKKKLKELFVDVDIIDLLSGDMHLYLFCYVSRYVFMAIAYCLITACTVVQAVI